MAFFEFRKKYLGGLTIVFTTGCHVKCCNFDYTDAVAKALGPIMCLAVMVVWLKRCSFKNELRQAILYAYFLADIIFSQASQNLAEYLQKKKKK